MRDVGPRHLADIEAVARLLELLGENFDVAAVEVENSLVAQQIHVSGGRIEQHLLFGDAQGLARAHDLALRLPRLVRVLKTVEQRFGRGGAKAALPHVLGDVRIGDGVGKHLLIDTVRQRAGISEAVGAGDTQFRPVARQSLRHVLIRRAQGRPLRIERRVVLISLDERPFQRVGGSREIGENEHEQKAGYRRI